MWVRGLKRGLGGRGQKRQPSHPVWVRGLKLLARYIQIVYAIVAPRVGAWIETLHNCITTSLSFVAPRVGAWIETLHIIVEFLLQNSRTPCGCVD
mgnify:FL=1